MSRYIPPALRKQQEAQAQAQAQPSTSGTSNSPDSESALQPRRLSELKLSKAIPGLDVQDIHDYFQKGADDIFLGAQSTLNATAEAPNRLGYLMLFSGANPRWAEDRIIFAKTKIDLLPGYEEAFAETATADAAEQSTSTQTSSSGDQPSHSDTPTQPNVSESASDQLVAVFKQSHVPYSQQTKGFKFAGWFCIERVDFLLPHSDGLARMLEQKWRSRKRDGEAWESSFGQRWAVLKMMRSEVQGEAPDVKAGDGQEDAGLGREG